MIRYEVTEVDPDICVGQVQKRASYSLYYTMLKMSARVACQALPCFMLRCMDQLSTSARSCGRNRHDTSSSRDSRHDTSSSRDSNLSLQLCKKFVHSQFVALCDFHELEACTNCSACFTCELTRIKCTTGLSKKQCSCTPALHRIVLLLQGLGVRGKLFLWPPLNSRRFECKITVSNQSCHHYLSIAIRRHGRTACVFRHIHELSGRCNT